jgi:hypothetical protein
VLFGDASGALLTWRLHTEGMLRPLAVALPGKVFCLAAAPPQGAPGAPPRALAGCADGSVSCVELGPGGDGDGGALLWRVAAHAGPVHSLHCPAPPGERPDGDSGSAAGGERQQGDKAAERQQGPEGEPTSQQQPQAGPPPADGAPPPPEAPGGWRALGVARQAGPPLVLLSAGEDGKLQLWRLGAAGAPAGALPAQAVFAWLPKPPGGSGGRGGGRGTARVARLWAAARVLPGSLAPGGGCTVVAAGFNGGLLLYRLEPGGGPAGRGADCAASRSLPAAAPAVSSWISACCLQPRVSHARRLCCPRLPPGRRPEAPVPLRGAHNRPVFQIEVLPPPPPPARSQRGAEAAAAGEAAVEPAAAEGGAAGSEAAAAAAAGAAADGAAPYEAPQLLSCVVATVSQDRHLALTELRAPALKGAPSSSGSSGSSGSGGSVAAAASPAQARGSDGDSWRRQDAAPPPERPQAAPHAAARVLWSVAGLGGYAYSAATARAPKGGRTLLAVACGDKTIRLATLKRGTAPGAAAGVDGSASEAGSDGGPDAAAAARGPAAGGAAAPPPVVDEAKEATIVWQGLQDKALTLAWHPNNPGAAPPSRHGTPVLCPADAPTSVCTASTPRSCRRLQSASPPTPSPPSSPALHGPAGLLAYGCSDGRVGLVSTKAAQAEPFGQRHSGPALALSWQQLAGAAAPGAAAPPPPASAASDGEEAPAAQAAAAAPPPAVPKAARPAALYSLGGEGCVLQWPMTAAFAGGAGGGGGGEREYGGRGSGWDRGGSDARPADVSAALDEAWAALRLRRAAAAPGGAAGGGDGGAAGGGADHRWTSIAWHPDGRLLAAGTATGSVALFRQLAGGDAGGGRADAPAPGAAWAAVEAFKAGTAPVLQLRWSPCGGVLVAADQRQAYLFGPAPGAGAGAAGAEEPPGRAPAPRLQATPPLDARAKGVRDVAFSGDGTLCVARGDGVVQVGGARALCSQRDAPMPQLRPSCLLLAPQPQPQP